VTDIDYEGEVKVGGMIASVGQRLMDMTSKMMIKRFFTALENEIVERD
jgi:carbon monoxide dehydrogenase subunit G